MLFPLATSFGHHLPLNSFATQGGRRLRQNHHFCLAGRLRLYSSDTNHGEDGAQNYVLGYGSIICSVSRAITCPELAASNVTATPVQVRHTERVWSKRSVRGMTAMGIQRGNPEATCTAVLLPVTSEQLLLFDERERGYDRLPVPVSHVEKVPFLESSYYDRIISCETVKQLLLEDHESDSSSTNGVNADIWIYEPIDFCPPSREKPIVQTYVDTILRGCLSISEEFAADFLRTTRGWSSMEELGLDHDEKENIHDNESKNTSDNVHWVNDRDDPVYLRGDQGYILEHAAKLDLLLESHRPKEFSRRGALDRNTKFS